MKHYGLIGLPLKHSFSKKYFDNKFRKENIQACYSNFEIAHCEKLHQLINENQLDGLNVTIPFKQQVIHYLDEIDEVAKQIGAVNCIQIKQRKLKGFNTDIIGFEKSLLETTQLKNKKALIFGNGGASKAVAFVLHKHDVPFYNVSRNEIQGGLTYRELTDSIIGEHQLLINTTPVGMFPKIDEELPIPYKAINHTHTAFDLIYNPEKTNFLTFCEAEGATIQNGLNMLHYQAEAAYEIFIA